MYNKDIGIMMITFMYNYIGDQISPILYVRKIDICLYTCTIWLSIVFVYMFVCVWC